MDFKIGKLASKLGISTQAIRYYEKIGMLEEPKRNEAGYRLYSQVSLERLQLIRIAQNFGLSLTDIKSIIDANPKKNSLTISLHNFLQANLEDLDKQLAVLNSSRDKLSRRLEVLNQLIVDDKYQVFSHQELLNLMEKIESESSFDHQLSWRLASLRLAPIKNAPVSSAFSK